jgi:hypothetical protein
MSILLTLGAPLRFGNVPKLVKMILEALRPGMNLVTKALVHWRTYAEKARFFDLCSDDFLECGAGGVSGESC